MTGSKVTSEMVLHFLDGSLEDETTVFSQTGTFRLLSDHLRQEGPSFPEPVDARVDARDGIVEVRSLKGSDSKSERHPLKMPPDVANGLIVPLLENLPRGQDEATFSLVTTSSTPRVVKLEVRRVGEDRFSCVGSPVKAFHYVVHPHVEGLAGAVASVLGKQPEDLHFWITGGEVPTFVRATAPLYEQGPMWSIELASLNAEEKKD
ncbi:MAG: hypothetical protein JO361_01590 [Gammaproteobacteria bacterium]|nr:hypothetical protein [Gammaproteobacteria bacterium]